MYSTLALTNSKKSGNIVGTHQKLDRIARKLLQKNLPSNVYFPDIIVPEKEIADKAGGFFGKGNKKPP